MKTNIPETVMTNLDYSNEYGIMLALGVNSSDHYLVLHNNEPGFVIGFPKSTCVPLCVVCCACALVHYHTLTMANGTDTQ